MLNNHIFFYLISDKYISFLQNSKCDKGNHMRGMDWDWAVVSNGLPSLTITTYLIVTC